MGVLSEEEFADKKKVLLDDLDVLSASDDPIKKCCYLSGALMFSLKIAFDRVLQIIGRLSFRATNASISENAVQDGVQKYCDKFSKC